MIWIASAPAGVKSSGPTVCSSADFAEKYREMGWSVEGPYICLKDIIEYIENTDHVRCTAQFWATLIKRHFEGEQ